MNMAVEVSGSEKKKKKKTIYAIPVDGGVEIEVVFCVVDYL